MDWMVDEAVWCEPASSVNFPDQQGNPGNLVSSAVFASRPSSRKKDALYLLAF